jgi:hypothetical protein
MAFAFLLIPTGVHGQNSDWSVGAYSGQYYDSEPAGILTHGRGDFQNQYLLALTASKTLWRGEALPLALELDGMVGHQFGTATLSEFAIAPVLRWSGFPWTKFLQTDLRFGPLGYSYTTSISSFELGKDGGGSQSLNFLMIEFDFSLPQLKSEEVFVRLHHRCAIYDLLNTYGANGEDFLALGYRHHF